MRLRGGPEGVRRGQCLRPVGPQTCSSISEQRGRGHIVVLRPLEGSTT